MAYVRSRYLTFKFDDVDPALEGLEIRTVRISSDTVVELMELKGLREEGSSDREVIERPFEILGDVLVSWNVQEEDDDGNLVDVQPGRDALLADIPWATKLLKAWMGAVTDIQRELGKGLPSGGTSQEQSIPMEPLSPSQENSLVPS